MNPRHRLPASPRPRACALSLVTFGRPHGEDVVLGLILWALVLAGIIFWPRPAVARVRVGDAGQSVAR